MSLDLVFLLLITFKMATDRKSESSLAQVKNKIKVVFLGDQSTGKTSILLRYMHDKFQQGQAATVGIDFMAKNISVKSTNLRLQLWDTAGQQRFRSLIPSYLKDATVNFIVFDLTNRRSFQNVREWLQLCNQSKKQKSITFLLGNKYDLKKEREVTQEEASQFAFKEGISYYEVSAKSNHNIRQIFKIAAEQYVNQAYANEETIGNIQNIHNNYVNKMGQKQKKNAPAVTLSQHPITSTKKKNKKTGCC